MTGMAMTQCIGLLLIIATLCNADPETVEGFLTKRSLRALPHHVGSMKIVKKQRDEWKLPVLAHQPNENKPSHQSFQKYPAFQPDSFGRPLGFQGNAGAKAFGSFLKSENEQPRQQQQPPPYPYIPVQQSTVYRHILPLTQQPPNVRIASNEQHVAPSRQPIVGFVPTTSSQETRDFGLSNSNPGEVKSGAPVTSTNNGNQQLLQQWASRDRQKLQTVEDSKDTDKVKADDLGKPVLFSDTQQYGVELNKATDAENSKIKNPDQPLSQQGGNDSVSEPRVAAISQVVDASVGFTGNADNRAAVAGMVIGLTFVVAFIAMAVGLAGQGIIRRYTKKNTFGKPRSGRSGSRMRSPAEEDRTPPELRPGSNGQPSYVQPDIGNGRRGSARTKHIPSQLPGYGNGAMPFFSGKLILHDPPGLTTGSRGIRPNIGNMNDNGQMRSPPSSLGAIPKRMLPSPAAQVTDVLVSPKYDDEESETEEEDSDDTVYECPGLAATSGAEMVVRNPFFMDGELQPTPINMAAMNAKKNPISQYPDLFRHQGIAGFH